MTKVHIREGQFVKAGEPLFTLDARADEANVSKARAQMEKDLAALADASGNLHFKSRSPRPGAQPSAPPPGC